MRVGQRAQQHGVYDAEDGGIGADAERQGQQDNGSVGGVLSQVAERESDVLRHHVDRAHAPRLATVVHDQGDAAEVLTGRVARRVGGHPSGDERLGLHLQVVAEFRVHPPLEGGGAERSPKAPEHRQDRHTYLTVRLKPDTTKDR